GEHGGVGEVLLHELQAHEPIVHVVEGGAGELDHVHFEAIARQLVHEGADERLGLRVRVMGAVDQVDPDPTAGASCWRVAVVSLRFTWTITSEGASPGWR